MSCTPDLLGPLVDVSFLVIKFDWWLFFCPRRVVSSGGWLCLRVAVRTLWYTTYFINNYLLSVTIVLGGLTGAPVVSSGSVPQLHPSPSSSQRMPRPIPLHGAGHVRSRVLSRGVRRTQPEDGWRAARFRNVPRPRRVQGHAIADEWNYIIKFIHSDSSFGLQFPNWLLFFCKLIFNFPPELWLPLIYIIMCVISVYTCVVFNSVFSFSASAGDPFWVCSQYHWRQTNALLHPDPSREWMGEGSILPLIIKFFAFYG